MDKYMAVATLVVYRGDFNWYNEELASSIPHINEKCWLWADLWSVMEGEDIIKYLQDGNYRITAWGDVWEEYDKNPETGREEGGYEFGWDDIRIINMSDKEKIVC